MLLVKRHFKRYGRPAIASLMAGLVMLLTALAACPGLHELIHQDARDPGHSCATTLFAHGQVDSVVADVPIIATPVPFEVVPLVSISVFAPAIENLPAGRAPPACFSSIV